MIEKRIEIRRGLVPLLAAFALSACPGPHAENASADVSNEAAPGTSPTRPASDAAAAARPTVTQSEVSSHDPKPIGDWADDAAALAAWRAAKLPAGTYGFGTIAGAPIAITDTGEIVRIETDPAVGSGPPERPPTKPGTS